MNALISKSLREAVSPSRRENHCGRCPLPGSVIPGRDVIVGALVTGMVNTSSLGAEKESVISRSMCGDHPGGMRRGQFASGLPGEDTVGDLRTRERRRGMGDREELAGHLGLGGAPFRVASAGCAAVLVLLLWLVR